MALRMWFIEQNNTDRTGDRLTEALVIAENESGAFAAIENACEGFGVTINRKCATLIDLGLAPGRMLAVVPRWKHDNDSRVMILAELPF